MQKTLSLLFFVVTLNFFGQIPTIGLVGGWSFTGNANDISGNGNHGTVNGATLTKDRFNIQNCAYNFNGTSDFIKMLNAGPIGSVSRSISFWERSTNTIGPTSGFSYGSSGSGGIFQVNFNYNCKAVGFDNSSSAVMRGSNVINNGQWHHIVAILDATVGATTGQVKIYIDGIIQPVINCTQSGSNSACNTNAQVPIIIGLDLPNGYRYFKGDLDDFYFYNKALNQEEILQLYNDKPCGTSSMYAGIISGPKTLCSSSSTIYSIAPVSGATSYSWTIPSGWSGTSNTNTIYVTAGANTGTISAIAGNTCMNSMPTEIFVNVLSSPSVRIITDKSAICSGSSAQFTANGATSYTWFPGNTSSFLLGVNPSISQTYTLFGTGTNGCVNKAEITITVIPTPTIQATTFLYVCSGPANLKASGAESFTWQPGNLVGSSVSPVPLSTTIYTVIGANAMCTNSAQATVSIGIAPEFKFTVDKSSICQKECISTSHDSSTFNVFKYGWGDTLESISMSANHCYSDAGVFTITATGQFTSGCSVVSTSTMILNVNPIPSINLNVLGGMRQITEVPIVFDNQTIGSNNFEWNFGDTSDVFRNNVSGFLEHKFLHPGNYCIQLVATDSITGCRDTLKTCLQLECVSKINMPNVFTPNFDGVNDVFKFLTKCLTFNKCIVYNRWGQVVFQTNSENEFWDGKLSGGKVADDGVYLYIVEYLNAKNEINSQDFYLNSAKINLT